MFYLVADFDGDSAMFHCECVNIEFIDYADMEYHDDEHCILKDDYKLVCEKCNIEHTDRDIYLEDQTIRINVPQCPTCGSYDVKKISTGKKLVSYAAVGVFSSDFAKTYCCKNCSYKW